MRKEIGIIASIFGGLAVVAGAFGAHILKEILDEKYLDIWNKGVQYQFYHTFALLFIASLYDKADQIYLKRSALFFVLGIILFSGSLYILAFKEVISYSPLLLKIIGPITPLGGVCFIIGWILLLINFNKH
jgi:uncharacterized membrane protein YgdD (TMEM256/DUF423 family)